MITPWHVTTMVAMACGAIIPGPCSFVPDTRWDCSLGDPCPEGFACAEDGYCKSADVACTGGLALCEYPGLNDVGICVRESTFDSDPAHCGGCFNRCRGGALCQDGACVDEPAVGACVVARGHFDCPAGEVCRDGACVVGDGGAGAIFADCRDGNDCAGGLCSDSLCTRPCDIGCPQSSVCEAGVCVPHDGECLTDST